MRRGAFSFWGWQARSPVCADRSELLVVLPLIFAAQTTAIAEKERQGIPARAGSLAGVPAK
jgi:hypothetical protein